MNIKILGPGCARCHQLEKTARDVVKELSIDATIEEVKDMMKIVQYPILTTPGLLINGELVCAGRVPTKAEVTQLITNALNKEDKTKGQKINPGTGAVQIYKEGKWRARNLVVPLPRRG